MPLRPLPPLATPLALALALAATAPATAQIVTEDFESGNTHGWSVDFLSPATHFAAGGNPGGRIQVDVQSSQSMLPAPMVVPTAAGQPWSGDFRAAGVASFRFDREVELGAANFGTRLTLVLGNDAGTPTDPLDDAIAFVATGDVFQFGSSPWTTLSVQIPSADPVLDTAAGWDADAFPNSLLVGSDPDLIWNTVIEDVSYVGIAMDRPLGGAFWFGAHIINLDNFALEGSGLSGTNYCGPAVPNSTGQSGVISALGSPLVSANDVTLAASDLPPGQFGIFIASRDPGFVPGLGGNSNGNLCLGGTIGRFVGPGEILSTGAGGSFGLRIDLTAIPEGGSTATVMPGETWRFQAWHRDGVGLGSNLTDGIALSFN